MSTLREAKSRRSMLSVLLAGGAAGALAVARTGTAVEVSAAAPDFTLPATTGEKVTLSQFRGNRIVLLEFYGGAFVPT
jgi:cytochrome oxidase Cu insertion factor (SCO1/SenC/PrrC family)